MSKVDRYYTMRLRRAFGRGDLMAIYRLQHAWQLACSHTEASEKQ